MAKGPTEIATGLIAGNGIANSGISDKASGPEGSGTAARPAPYGRRLPDRREARPALRWLAPLGRSRISKISGNLPAPVCLTAENIDRAFLDGCRRLPALFALECPYEPDYGGFTVN